MARHARLATALFFSVAFTLPAAGCRSRDAEPLRDPVRLESYDFGGDFSLTAHDGRPFRLSDQRGKVVLLFFGYASCPDVCPTTLSTVKQVEEQLGTRRGQLLTVFVSVDPERDTPPVLKQYVDHFGINVVAATGAKPAIDAIVAQYKAHYAIVPSDSALGYLVEHTSILYLIDQEGRVRYLFRYGDPADFIVEGVTQLLR